MMGFSTQTLLVLITIFFVNYPLLSQPIEITWDDLYRTERKGTKMSLDPNVKVKGIPDISEFGNSQEELNRFFDDVKFMKESQPQGLFINMDLNKKEI